MFQPRCRRKLLPCSVMVERHQQSGNLEVLPSDQTTHQERIRLIKRQICKSKQPSPGAGASCLRKLQDASCPASNIWCTQAPPYLLYTILQWAQVISRLCVTASSRYDLDESVAVAEKVVFWKQKMLWRARRSVMPAKIPRCTLN